MVQVSSNVIEDQIRAGQQAAERLREGIANSQAAQHRHQHARRQPCRRDQRTSARPGSICSRSSRARSVSHRGRDTAGVAVPNAEHARSRKPGHPAAPRPISSITTRRSGDHGHTAADRRQGRAGEEMSNSICVPPTAATSCRSCPCCIAAIGRATLTGLKFDPERRTAPVWSLTRQRRQRSARRHLFRGRCR